MVDKKNLPFLLEHTIILPIFAMKNEDPHNITKL